MQQVMLEQAAASLVHGDEAQTMRVVLQTRYGTAPEDVLRCTTVARPIVGDAEVLVRVHAASVDRGTWHLMSGLQYPIRLGSGLRSPKAFNPGRSVAGVVVGLGATVSDFRVGDEVYGTCTSSFAQFACAQPKRLALKPVNLSFLEAAAMPVSGLTALQALRDKARVKSGDRVLVIGASGGVGTFCVQLAAHYDARVTGVCSAAKVELVRSLGAARVLDYSTQRFLDAGERYDVIIDTGGNSRLSDLRRAMTRNGRLVSVGGESASRWLWPTARRQLASLFLAPFTRQTLRSLLASENAADLSVLRAITESGALRPAIDQVFALSDSAAAVRHVVDGKARGKVVIDVAE